MRARLPKRCCAKRARPAGQSHRRRMRSRGRTCRSSRRGTRRRGARPPARSAPGHRQLPSCFLPPVRAGVAARRLQPRPDGQLTHARAARGADDRDLQVGSPDAARSTRPRSFEFEQTSESSGTRRDTTDISREVIQAGRLRADEQREGRLQGRGRERGLRRRHEREDRPERRGKERAPVDHRSDFTRSHQRALEPHAEGRRDQGVGRGDAGHAQAAQPQHLPHPHHDLLRDPRELHGRRPTCGPTRSGSWCCSCPRRAQPRSRRFDRGTCAPTSGH